MVSGPPSDFHYRKKIVNKSWAHSYLGHLRQDCKQWMQLLPEELVSTSLLKEDRLLLAEDTADHGFRPIFYIQRKSAVWIHAGCFGDTSFYPFSPHQLPFKQIMIGEDFPSSD